jgi:hypothetical protein
MDSRLCIAPADGSALNICICCASLCPYLPYLLCLGAYSLLNVLLCYRVCFSAVHAGLKGSSTTCLSMRCNSSTDMGEASNCDGIYKSEFDFAAITLLVPPPHFVACHAALDATTAAAALRSCWWLRLRLPLQLMSCSCTVQCSRQQCSEWRLC